MRGDDYRFETWCLAGLMLIAAIGIIGNCVSGPARADEILPWDQPEPGADGWSVLVDGVEQPVAPVGSGPYSVTVPDQVPVEWCWDVVAYNEAGRTKSSNGPLCRRGICSYDLNANGILDLGDLGWQIGRIPSEGLSPLGTIIRGLRTLCPSNSP